MQEDCLWNRIQDWKNFSILEPSARMCSLQHIPLCNTAIKDKDTWSNSTTSVSTHQSLVEVQRKKNFPGHSLSEDGINIHMNWKQLAENETG